jgi:hypothetical protein
MILFCARSGKSIDEIEVKFHSILELEKSEKSEFFLTESEVIHSQANSDGDERYETIEVSSPDYKFRPVAHYEQELYARFWQLCPRKQALRKGERVVFLRHCSGLKLGITGALVHVDREILLRRTRDVGNAGLPYEALKANWFQGQVKPPREASLTVPIRHEIGTYCSQRDRGRQHALPYAFRPFCPAYAFLPIPVLRKLASTGGGGSRYRPEVLSAYSMQGNMGISVAPAPEDIGETLHRFSSFAWHIPDNDLCTRGNGHVFCLFFPEYRRSGRSWDNQPRLNVSTEVLRALGHRSGNPENLARSLVWYVYAILCSNVYLDRFEGILYQTAGQWPRIPLTGEKRLFRRISELGMQLAQNENFEINVNPAPDIIDCLNPINTNEIRIKKCTIDIGSSTITIKSMDGEDCLISELDREIIGYKVAGYSVLKDWLKWRTWPYLRRAFRQEDAQSLASLLTRIRLQFETIKNIDSGVQRILSDPSHLV